VRRTPRVLLATVVVATVSLTGCSTANSGNSIRHQLYTYTCCEGSSALEPVRHPGETLTLQWIAESAGTTSDSTSRSITLAAVLTGPYQNVAGSKNGSAAPLTLRALPVVTTDRTKASPVSTIVLPVDLLAGFYNLAEDTELFHGNRVGSATIIQVSPAGS
jgi:hypothetical protein